MVDKVNGTIDVFMIKYLTIDNLLFAHYLQLLFAHYRNNCLHTITTIVRTISQILFAHYRNYCSYTIARIVCTLSQIFRRE